MSEEAISDDQSHYEVSLTAGQAFLAFVLLLLSLAASFAFGLMIGRGHGDERMLAQSSPTIADEAAAVPKKAKERIEELGISDDASFREPAAKEVPPVKSAAKAIPAATITEEPAAERERAQATPHYAQLLSTSDQKKAEALAATVIDGGFMGAYVERTTNEKGPLFRVRVNFASEAEARAAEPKLRGFSKDVWITRQ